MSQSRFEWKVGLFVFTCLLLLAALLVYFSKGLTFLTPTYELILKTSNVGGIKPQAAVLMSGVPVGNVVKSELIADGKSVVIRLKIYKRYPIHADAEFVIEQSGFLGDQFVAIKPGKNEGRLLKDGDPVTCLEPFNLQEVARSAAGFLRRIDETAKKLNEAITRVDQLVLDAQTLTNLSVTIGNFRHVSERALETVEGLDLLVQSNRPPVNTAVSNVVVFSEQLNNLAADLQGLVATNRIEFSAAVKNVESSTVIIKSLLGDLQAGKGLAGSLLKDEKTQNEFATLLNSLNTASSNLTITTSNLNTHGLWWMLWKPKPVKTNLPPRSGFGPGRDPRR